MPTDNPHQQDRIILAFAPSDADHATDGHTWSLYNPALDNPYSVPNPDEKLRKARERFDPHDYERQDDEHWIRLDWQSVIDGDPERLSVERSQMDDTHDHEVQADGGTERRDTDSFREGHTVRHSEEGITGTVADTGYSPPHFLVEWDDGHETLESFHTVERDVDTSSNHNNGASNGT